MWVHVQSFIGGSNRSFARGGSTLTAGGTRGREGNSWCSDGASESGRIIIMHTSSGCWEVIIWKDAHYNMRAVCATEKKASEVDQRGGKLVQHPDCDRVRNGNVSKISWGWESGQGGKRGKANASDVQGVADIGGHPGWDEGGERPQAGARTRLARKINVGMPRGGKTAGAHGPTPQKREQGRGQPLSYQSRASYRPAASGGPACWGEHQERSQPVCRAAAAGRWRAGRPAHQAVAGAGALLPPPKPKGM